MLLEVGLHVGEAVRELVEGEVHLGGADIKRRDETNHIVAGDADEQSRLPQGIANSHIVGPTGLETRKHCLLYTSDAADE